jgi:exocyst complex protein 7
LGTLSINAPPSKSQKQLLKDHFKGFNVELEELLRIQKDYSIPDSTLRRRVRDENITLIVIPYSNFYHDYSSVNFTKNYDKYVKFRPEEVEDKLNMFFDQGAQ